MARRPAARAVVVPASDIWRAALRWAAGIVFGRIGTLAAFRLAPLAILGGPFLGIRKDPVFTGIFLLGIVKFLKNKRFHLSRGTNCRRPGSGRDPIHQKSIKIAKPLKSKSQSNGAVVMTEELKNKPYLTPTEVAQWMMVSPVTVRGWAQKGLLQAEVTPGGHRRFRYEEVERFARQWNPVGNKGPLRILVVDDDRAVVGFLKELLEGGEYQTVLETAFDGFDAGRKVHAFAPDVVLLDLMMPGIKGTDVCRTIKQTPGLANVRVIAMSGYLSAENEMELLAAGAECCFSKPIDTTRLLKVLGLED